MSRPRYPLLELVRIVHDIALNDQRHARRLTFTRYFRPCGTYRRYATNPTRSNDYPSSPSDQVQESSYAQPAHDHSQDVGKDETRHYDKVLEQSKQQQMRSPWTRVDSDLPPVARERTADAMTKGKLLTTPSRMLKLILPLAPHSRNSEKAELEPLALLVHPQQPLSYLERLIQSELPTIKDRSGRDKIPEVTFRALDTGDDMLNAEQDADDNDVERGDEMMVDGKLERTGRLRSTTSRPESSDSSSKGASPHKDFVKWSPSTEIGDFIRLAHRGQEFSVDIEGSTAPIFVAVPSFEDRTYYLRMRLRRTARQIAQMADLKDECDKLAHRAAKRVAMAGFGGLVLWWFTVYVLTFRTDGVTWDIMEPVTYLVGLSGLIGGYLWFLLHNREVSYKSAMNLTISRRQSKLYALRGFDLPRWEGLVEEGNRLRREIKLVSEEYDVDWDEKQEAGGEKVATALRKERQKKSNKNKDQDKEEDPVDD